MKMEKLLVANDELALLYQVIHERFDGSLLVKKETMMQFVQKSSEGKVLVGAEEDADGNLRVKVEVMS